MYLFEAGLYAFLSVVCVIGVTFYKAYKFKALCFVSSAFFFVSILFCIAPPPDVEFSLINNVLYIPATAIYFGMGLALFVFLAAAKAKLPLLIVGFCGLIAHLIGFISYITDYPAGLVLYNHMVFVLNFTYAALLLGLSDAGLDAIHRGSNYFRRHVMDYLESR
jgi:hypothetical protein